jgi:hypothetical protein
MFGRKAFALYSGETAVLNGRRDGSKIRIVDAASPDKLRAIIEARERKRAFEMSTVAGDESLSCRIGTVTEPFVYHRYIVVDLRSGQRTERLNSQMPTKGTGGTVCLNFGGRFTQASIKNAILLNQDQNTALIVRKISAEDLEVENFGGYSDLVCFAFAISSWLCPC